ncbi:MAG: alpha/beta hydrolase [Bacteroidetes bacterium B1(2017)]|nr:MAG: alpha/beta hydrolase [Bacteroidetes bacterium B1(2017)]
MPQIGSTFSGNKFSKNGHLETILPAVFRRNVVSYTRERVPLPDTDFIDLDWLKQGNKKLLLLFHGLEGSSHSQYILGFAKYFSAHGFDICAVNFRSCSGEPNELLSSYHSGASHDVDFIVKHINLNYSYEKLYATGFSLGGNVLLKYLGEQVYTLPQNLKSAAAFSVPIDLAASSKKLSSLSNSVYMRRFLGSLNQKLYEKKTRFPDALNIDGLEKIKTFDEWDDRFTAPIHGFLGSADYYKKSSSKQFLKGISIPTLLVNAQNDPFLAAECFPNEIEIGENLFFESPKYGGHCGFAKSVPNGEYFSEERALHFFSN